MAARPTTIDAYLDSIEADHRSALQTLRKQIQAAAPDAEECLAYGLPAFRLNGLLVGFRAAAHHCAFILMNGTTVAAFKKELADYDTSKGTIRFTPDAPLPAALVRKLVKARAAENAAKNNAKAKT